MTKKKETNAGAVALPAENGDLPDEIETTDLSDESIAPNEIVARRDELKAMQADLIRARNIYTDGIGGDFRDSIVADLDDAVQEIHGELEYCKPSEVAMLQGKLQGIKQCRSKIKGDAWDEKMAEAQANLEQFEEKNALFMQSESVDDDVVAAFPSKITVEVGKGVQGPKLKALLDQLFSNGFNRTTETGRIYTADLSDWDAEEIGATRKFVADNSDKFEMVNYE